MKLLGNLKFSSRIGLNFGPKSFKFQYTPQRPFRNSTLVRSIRNGYYSRNPNNLVIWGIIGINGAVFLAWRYAMEEARVFNNSASLKFMQRNFTLGMHSFDNWHTFITSHFSHVDILHLGINMMVFHSFGTTLIGILGASRFLQLYFVSGIASAATSMAYKVSTQSNYFPTPASLGASGCVSGVTAVFAWMFPTAELSLLFIPIPAWLGVFGFLTYDLYKAVKGTQGRIDCAGHIGGGLGGLLWYLIL